VRDRIEKALKQGRSEFDFPKLADQVGGRIAIRDAPPLSSIRRSSWTPNFQETVETVFALYRDIHRGSPESLDRYRFVDAAIKVVGVGSVGRRCWIALLMSASNDPLFLQFKEAAASVLEPWTLGPVIMPIMGNGPWSANV